MIPYEITEETIKNATSYVPALEKERFIQYAASRCFITLNISALPNNSSKKAMPAMYKINTLTKNRYLMGALAKLYLHEDYIPIKDDEWLMSLDDYDNFKSGHIFNALNRFKSNNEIRDKVFDLMSDFKELTMMLEEELEETSKALNDSVSRIYMMLCEMLSPQEMENMLKTLEEKTSELESYMESKKNEGEN